MSTLVSAGIVRVEQDGAVVTITLNRPNKCNALSAELSAGLLEACRSVNDDAEVVVLRGNGRHFCAGSDLKELYGADVREAERLLQLEIDACHALASMPQVTIALLHGKCYGGGAILPLYCDLRIGVADTEFALPEVPFGWIPPYGIERMRALLPQPFSLEMLLSGRLCGDAEALHKGWIHWLENNDAPTAHLDRLLQVSRQTLKDTVSFMGAKNLEEMREADSELLKLFLRHFDTDYARGKLESHMNRPRS